MIAEKTIVNRKRKDNGEGDFRKRHPWISFVCRGSSAFDASRLVTGLVAVEGNIETGFGRAWITNRIVGTL
jgi:hypothetical protein